MITNYERCAREIKSRIAMSKAAFNKKNTFFNVFHVRALYYAKTLITNKCTKRVLS
jgi:hypothetical protein